MIFKVAPQQQSRPRPSERPSEREVLSEAAILAQLGEMSDFFCDPVTRELASKYLPDRLIRLADTGAGGCNWTVAPLDCAPAPMARYIMRQAQTLQARCELAATDGLETALRRSL